MTTRVHETAIVESDVQIGDGTSVWDHVHVRSGSRIGRNCIIGEKSYLGPDVVVGDLVKINSFVYLCTGVTLENGVMVSAHVVFTNDRYPRATTPDLQRLRPSEVDDATLSTLVCEGATIGAAAVIGPGIELGKFSMIGMGSVVTRTVADFNLVVGNPAAPVGYVCRCGIALHGGLDAFDDETARCGSCGRSYRMGSTGVIENDHTEGHTRER